MGNRGRASTKRPSESEFIVKKILVAAVVVSTLLLSGCSQVGAAANLGSTKITQSTVQASIDSILAERSKVDITQMQLETGEALNRSQMRFHLLSRLLLEVGTELKLSVTKAEIDTRRASILEQIGGVNKLPEALVGAQIAPLDLDAYLQAIILSGKISQTIAKSGVAEADVANEIQKLIIAKAAQLKVTVNPRYGKWDQTTGDVVAAESAGSAVTPAPTK